MEKAFTRVQHYQIAYTVYHAAKSATIFFVHGNSSSSQAWRKQVESAALLNYRLITIDLPNHGNSAALDADADYSLPALAKILGAVIRQLIDNKPYIICSVSLGTNMVAEMMADHFTPQGLLLAGTCIIGKGIGLDKVALPGADVSPVFEENVPGEKVIKYAKETSASTDAEDLKLFLEDYYAVKGSFRSNLYATVASGIFNDEIDILQKKNCPVCIVFGKEEKVVNTDYLNDVSFKIWNNNIYKIPGASHLVNIDAPEAFNVLLATFADAMFTAGDS